MMRLLGIKWFAANMGIDPKSPNSWSRELSTTLHPTLTVDKEIIEFGEKGDSELM